MPVPVKCSQRKKYYAQSLLRLTSYARSLHLLLTLASCACSLRLLLTLATHETARCTDLSHHPSSNPLTEKVTLYQHGHWTEREEEREKNVGH